MEELIVFLVLLALGYVAGTVAEKRHYRSIQKREAELIGLPAATIRNVGVEESQVLQARLVTGCAVISVDYFKRILAALRNIFGGTVKSYETLIDRARREALLRMKAEARGASVIANVRIETAAIGRGRQKQVACVEAIAYGTALELRR